MRPNTFVHLHDYVRVIGIAERDREEDERERKTRDMMVSDFVMDGF
jgi:hypothetical protein